MMGWLAWSCARSDTCYEYDSLPSTAKDTTAVQKLRPMRRDISEMSVAKLSG